MKRKMVIAFSGLLLLSAMPVVAQEVSPIHTIEQQEYNISLTTDDNLTSATVSGPINLLETNDSSDKVTARIETKEVPDVRSASVYFRLSSSGEERVDMMLFPDPRHQNGSSSEQIAEQYREDAITLRNIKDQYINQRTQRKKTARGTLTVFEYRDPTQGPIDPETGIPKGKWIEVSVNKKGVPQWKYDNTSELMTFLVEKAHTNNQQRGAMIFGSIAFVMVTIVGTVYWYPKRKKRKQEKEIWSGKKE